MYGKIFAQMYDGTLARKGPWQALVTFQQFIVLSNKRGEVDMTADAISRRTTLPLEIIEEGIKHLLEPDSESRTPDLDGRRIVPLSEARPWGWRIVNYEHYNKIRSEEERREYHRQYYYKRKVVETQHSTAALRNSTDSTPVSVDVPVSVKIKDSSVAQALHPTALPLRKGEELKIPETLVAEWSKIYPKVDIPATILEMRGWCLSNPSRLKTRRGALRFVNNWLRTAQEEYAQN
jgi:hypothetical protein